METGKANKRVLIVGQICADFISVTDSFPEEDSENRIKSQYWQKGGNGANCAVVLANLGTRVELFTTFPDMSKMEPSILGVHAQARYTLSELDRSNVDYRHLSLRECNSFPTTSIVINETTGSRTILHCRGPLGELEDEDFSVLDLNEYCWMHFEGRENGDVMKRVIERVQRHNSSLPEIEKLKVSVELEIPTHTQLECLCPLADLVIVSKDYAVKHGLDSGIETAETYMKRLKEGAEVVCSWGSLGATYARNVPENVASLEPAVAPGAVVDSLGAGDTFQAALIHAKLNDLTLQESVQFACEIASKKISDYGYDGIIGMGIQK